MFDSRVPDTIDRNDGPGPHVLSGLLRSAGGEPAAGARIFFFPVDFRPRAAAKATAVVPDSTQADSRGNFAISLSDGQYNMLARSDSTQAFLDSIAISGHGLELPPITLKPPGSLRGRIALQPNHNPRSAFIELMGSDLYANVDDTGGFYLERLPEGAYTLACRTTLSEYTPAFRSLNILSGSALILPEPVEPDFTGIPAVRGIRAEYDTASGVARISWRRSPYFALKDYLLVRDTADALAAPSFSTAVRDTFFSDTLYRRGWPAAFAGHPDSLPVDVEYRVRVRAKSDSTGPMFETSFLRAVPADWVATRIALRVLGGKGDSGRYGDTLRIAGSFRNRTRKLVSLAWSFDSASEPVRLRQVDSLAGEDTIAAVWDRAARPWVKLAVRDDAGIVRTDSIAIAIVHDSPEAMAGGDTLVSVGGALRLDAGASIRFGRIVKWEWDIGNTGAFREARDTIATAPGAPDTNYLCILRVTADNGSTGLDTLRVRIVPWARLADAPCKGSQPYGYSAVGPSRAVLDGKLYSLCVDDPYFPKKVQMQEFDPNTLRWYAKADAPSIGEGTRAYGMHAVEGKLYLPNPENLLAYDPASNQWSVMAKPPTMRTYNAEFGIPSIVVDGKLYLAGGSAYGGREGVPTDKLDIYDPATDTWKAGAPIPVPNINLSPNWGHTYGLIAAGNRLVLYTNSIHRDVSTPLRKTYLYESSADAWLLLDSTMTRMGTGQPSAVWEGKVYIRGESEAFEISTMKWVPAELPPEALEYHSYMASAGNRILFIRTDGVLADAFGRLRAPFTTRLWSWRPHSGTWESHIPLSANVEWMTMEVVANRLFLFTGDTESPMETFEYFLP